MIKRNIEKTNQLTRIAYELVHLDADLKTVLSYMVRSIREAVECEAVGIRLEKDGDFPYYVSDGFPEDFLSKESSLVVSDKHGKPIPCSSGCGVLLDCMCGRVIMGTTDSKKPFFTPRGTFFSNNTSNLLKTTSGEDRGGHTRNVCNECGYESVLLTPLLHRGDTIGLMQINDSNPDMFSSEIVLALEMLSDIISVLIGHKRLIDTARKNLSSMGETPSSTLVMCSHCKAVRIANNSWRSVESFIKETANVRISHAVCSACKEELVECTFKMSNMPMKHHE